MSDLAKISRCYSIRFERRSKHSAARLWRAITDPEELTAWMAYPARTDLRVGGDYFIDFGDDSEENLDGVIVRIEPERRLAYVWGLSVLEWEIEPREGACGYVFTHHGMLDRRIPDEEGVAAGWHAWLDGLDAHLDGRSLGPGGDRAIFEEVSLGYREQLTRVLGD